jgi:hypothetical protein
MAPLSTDDMRSDVGPRARTIERLCTALTVERYKALGLSTPLMFRQQHAIAKLNYMAPSVPTGTLIHLANSNEPIHITRTEPVSKIITTNKGSTGYPYIPASHANKCICSMLTANNNATTLSTARMCIPTHLTRQYIEDPDLTTFKNMENAGTRYRNPINIYFSEISECGTALPQLIRRQPVSIISRSAPMLYQPQYATIDLESQPQLLRSLVAQMWTIDFQAYTTHMNTYAGESKQDDIYHYRFRPIDQYLHNIDVASFGQATRSLEDIVINQPMITPFFGVQSCPYCSDVLQLQSPTDLMQHYLQEHRFLLVCEFTCPACIGIRIFNRDTYVQHYNETHAETSILMSTLTETRLHTRLQHGMILALLLTIANNENMTAEPKLPTYASIIGGYTIGPVQKLGRAIQTLQEHMLLQASKSGRQWINEHAPPQEPTNPMNLHNTLVHTPDTSRRARLPAQEPFLPRQQSLHRNQSQARRHSPSTRQQRSRTRSVSPYSRYSPPRDRTIRFTAAVPPMPQRNRRSRIDDIEPSTDNFSIMDGQQYNRRNRSPTPSTPPPEYEEYNQTHFMQLPVEPLDGDFSTIPVEPLSPQPQRIKQKATPVSNLGITPVQNNNPIRTHQPNSNIQHRPENETRSRIQEEDTDEYFPDESIQTQQD